ncbi:hypothetical protein Tco_0977932 [Tanacetum coccineum]|uniref:Uncharacterized protein n=1 Tax=Tanacetum coccineum TaxID=301880 RepID=A0ABQ5ELI7_9ASTR
MVVLRQLIHTLIDLLSNNDLKGTRTEYGFKRAFATLFGQDLETFTSTMFRKMDQLEKQLDNEEFQSDRIHDFLLDHRTDSKEQDTSSKSGNDAHADDADIRPIYDEELMAEVQTTAEINVFATGQQHTEQPEFNNEREVDQNAEQCHDTCPLPAKLTDNQITELSYQSLESENILKSNEAKIKHDIDVIETINIELKHKVAKLLKENETLKRHYKELSDSIKTTRAKTIEHTTSLIAQNAEFKAQLQEKGFAIAALKNELRKLTGNSVNTKFAKSSILGKPVLQPHRNQSVVRQPIALSDKLVSWMSKKQDCTTLSSAEAEYVALSASSDMFTKALPEDRFLYLVRRIGMRCLTPAELEVLANESA